MKKFIQSMLYSGLALIGYSNYAQAQEVSFAGSLVKGDPVQWHAFTNENAATGKPAAVVNAKVLRTFTKYYKDAHNVKWYQDKNTYIVFFDQAGMKSYASFGKGGRWNFAIAHGGENNLPTQGRKVVKSNYVDYAISNATKVHVGMQEAWIVNLEDANNLVIARIIDGSLDELAHYQTQEPQHTHRRARIIIPQ